MVSELDGPVVDVTSSLLVVLVDPVVMGWLATDVPSPVSPCTEVMVVMEEVDVASSGVQGAGIQREDAVGVLCLGFAAEKPQAKPAVKVAAKMTICLTLQLCNGPLGSRMDSGKEAASVISPALISAHGC